MTLEKFCCTVLKLWPTICPFVDHNWVLVS